MDKADFLRECMSEFKNAPIDTFNLAFCRVCANRDCVRSAANTMSFDKRVHSWQDTLFFKVPRANEEDHKFDYIRGKNFTPITPTDMPDTSGRPYEVKTFAEVPIPEIKSEKPSPAAPITYPVAPEIREAQEPPSQSQESPKTSEEPKQVPVVTNTPFSQGTILESEDVVVEPGATITFKN
jgi:hypothetical protein